MKRILRWVPAILFISLMTFLGLQHSTNPYHVDPVFMGFSGLGTYVCQRIQTDLLQYYRQNIAQFRTFGDTGYLKFLLSPQNRNGFTQIDVESIPGKKRGVAFMVDLPYCYKLCALNVECDNEDIVYADPETQEMTFDLTNPPFRQCDDDGNPVLLRFTESDMMKYCKNDDTTWMRNQIFRYLLRFEEALDEALTTILNTQIGTNGDGDSITNVPIFTAGNTFTPNMSVLNPEAMWYIDQLYSDIGNSGQYALLGGTIMNKLIKFQKWTGLNAAGVDMSKAPNDQPLAFYDRNFNTTFGISDIIMIAPGATQLVTWNKYKGEKARSVTDLYTKGTVVLPRTGLRVDYKWLYDYKCEIFTFEAFLHAELATVPAGGCGDNAAGINGLVRLHDCGTQPIIPACPPSASS